MESLYSKCVPKWGSSTDGFIVCWLHGRNVAYSGCSLSRLDWDLLEVTRTIENLCEMILSSARLSSNIPISTRNSCKTLKCPQCNWHYKYQETLEIHMREKHPDGESACGYCLAASI
uniref:C2H2-type domain-containing protein n=1 Tax=Glossina pallidipes TaxID=7398 RepID=A0A1A9ZSI8_GLOPL